MENAVNQRSPIRSEASSEPTFDFDLIWTLEGAETCTARRGEEHLGACETISLTRATFGSWDIRYFAIEVELATWISKS